MTICFSANSSSIFEHSDSTGCPKKRTFWLWKTLIPVSPNSNSESAFFWDTLYMYKRDYGDDLQSIMYSLGAGQGVGGVHKQQEEGGPSLETKGGQIF